MTRTINCKKARLFHVIILTLAVSMAAFAQTEQKIDGESQIVQKTPAVSYRISGTVTMKSDRQPVAKAKIQIRDINRPAAGTLLFTSYTLTDEQGRWTLNKVPDGEYLILIDPATTPATNSSQDGQVNGINSVPRINFVAQTYKATVSGTDIDNIAIQVIKGGRIIGKVVMDGGESLPKDLIVLPEQTVKDGRSPIRMVPVQSDGSFILEGVPTGEIILKTVVYGKPKEYYMKSATVDGLDLLREPLNIVDGLEIKDVHIVFAKTIDK